MKKLVCFDMDGTVNISDQLIDGAKEVFEYLNKEDIKFVFITNNSSKNANTYLRKMKKLGITCHKSNFFTSIELTELYLKKEGIKNIYLVGTTEFYKELQKKFNIVTSYIKNSIDMVVVGFDTELNYEKLITASKYIQDDVPFIGTNPDLRCPIEEQKYIPDCGSICNMLTLTTGKSCIFLGKPNKEMIDLLCEKYKIDKKDTIVVGDRLYTDILAGINAGCDTVAVLTGETSIEEINSSPYKPTYVIDSIRYLIPLLK